MNTPLPAPTTDGSYVDWPAIFAGSVVAVAIGLLLTAFGTALGLASITLDATDQSSVFELIATALWVVLTMIAAYLAGGYITGRMRRRVETASKDEVTVRDGVNGLVVWGLGTILSAMLISNIVSLAANTAGTVAASAGQAAGAIVQAAGTAMGGLTAGVADVAGAALPDASRNDPLDYLSNQLLRPAQVDATTADPAQLAQQAGSIMANVYRTGDVSDEDRAYLVSAVAARTGLTQADAAARVDQVITDAQTARRNAVDAVEAAKVEAERLAQEAEATALEAARIARNAGILTAFVLAASALIAGVAAFAGAVRGGRDRDTGRTTSGLRYTG